MTATNSSNFKSSHSLPSFAFQGAIVSPVGTTKNYVDHTMCDNQDSESHHHRHHQSEADDAREAEIAAAASNATVFTREFTGILSDLITFLGEDGTQNQERSHRQQQHQQQEQDFDPDPLPIKLGTISYPTHAGVPPQRPLSALSFSSVHGISTGSESVSSTPSPKKRSSDNSSSTSSSRPEAGGDSRAFCPKSVPTLRHQGSSPNHSRFAMIAPRPQVASISRPPQHQHLSTNVPLSRCGYYPSHCNNTCTSSSSLYTEEPLSKRFKLDYGSRNTADVSRTGINARVVSNASLPVGTTSKPKAPHVLRQEAALHLACCKKDATPEEIQSLIIQDPEAVYRPVTIKSVADVYNHIRGVSVRKVVKKTYRYPIHLAIEHRLSTEVVSMLIDAGPRALTQQDGPMLETPLALLLKRMPNAGHIVVKMLIANGRCASIQDRHSNTPLHAAAMYHPENSSFVKVVKHLYIMNPGAISMINFHGKTPLEIVQTQKSCQLSVNQVLSFLVDKTEEALQTNFQKELYRGNYFHPC